MARGKKVTIENVDQAIAEILNKYEGDVFSNLKEITQEVTRKGVRVVKNEALGMFTDVHLPHGRYGANFTSSIETGRLSAQGTIYNNQYPGLTHLLEYGHATRNGGRVPGRAHLKPVEERITQEYIQKIEAGL